MHRPQISACVFLRKHHCICCFKHLSAAVWALYTLEHFITALGELSHSAQPSIQSLFKLSSSFVLLSVSSIMCSLESIGPRISQISRLCTRTHTSRQFSSGKKGKRDVSRLQAHLPFRLSQCIHFFYDLLLQEIPPMELENRPGIIACVDLYVLVGEWNIECCLKHSSEVAVAGVEWGNDIKQLWSLNITRYAHPAAQEVF